jgi:hypothetical protein
MRTITAGHECPLPDRPMGSRHLLRQTLNYADINVQILVQAEVEATN